MLQSQGPNLELEPTYPWGAKLPGWCCCPDGMALRYKSHQELIFPFIPIYRSVLLYDKGISAFAMQTHCAGSCLLLSFDTSLHAASRNSASQAVKGPCNVSLEKAQLTVYNLKSLHFLVLYFTLSTFSRELRVKRQKV